MIGQRQNNQRSDWSRGIFLCRDVSCFLVLYWPLVERSRRGLEKRFAVGACRFGFSRIFLNDSEWEGGQKTEGQSVPTAVDFLIDHTNVYYRANESVAASPYVRRFICRLTLKGCFHIYLMWFTSREINMLYFKDFFLKLPLHISYIMLCLHICIDSIYLYLVT